MQGDVQSAIKHLRSVSHLRQWSDEWNVAQNSKSPCRHRRYGRVLAGMNNIQTFSEFANANGITTNRLVKEKLLDTAQAYNIECKNGVSDINKLTSHIQSVINPTLRVRTRPDANEAAVSIRLEMVGIGDNRQADPSRGVQPDNEVTEDNPSIWVESFGALTESASQ